MEMLCLFLGSLVLNFVLIWALAQKRGASAESLKEAVLESKTKTDADLASSIDSLLNDKPGT